MGASDRALGPEIGIRDHMHRVDGTSGSPESGAASPSRARDGKGRAEIDHLRETVQILSHALHRLSHDLREPIRTVTCYTEMLQRSPAVSQDPNLSEFAHIVAGAAGRIETLVRSMLDYSRLMGEQPQPPAKVDMNAVVQTALANLQVAIEESGAAVVYDALPPVQGDAVQLAELVQNLLANSIKYRGSEPPQVCIRCEPLDRELLFSVDDNGIGIAAEDAGSIFSPFKRLHGQDVPGTGLGLAICRRISEIHHGRIWVESVPGKGSTFHFTLPPAA